jgi:hypothetical protein
VRHAPVQHCANVWGKRDRRTFHPVQYAGCWLRIVEILEGSLLVVDSDGLVVIERIDLFHCGASTMPTSGDLLSSLIHLVHCIEAAYADSEDLRHAFLDGDHRAASIAQLNTLAAGFHPGTCRYLVDLVDELVDELLHEEVAE